MTSYPRELEVSRLMNLARGFGWEKKKEEVQGTKLVVTLEKKILTEDQVTEPVIPS